MSVNEPTDDWSLDEPAVSTPLLTGSGHESPAECSLAANSKGPKEDPLSIGRTDDDAVVVQAQKTTGTSHPKSIRSKSHKKSVHYAPGPALSDPPNPTVPFADVPGLKGSSEISGNTGPTHRRHHPPKGSSEGCFYGSFHEAPTFMQENPFVHTGYRLQHTYTDCLLSWFGLHNETGNIWTHLLGSAVIVALVAVWGPNLFTSSPLITPIHQLVWGVFIIGSIGCLACSTVYHTFTCHSAHTSQTCRSVDYLGVNLLILGSAYPMFYYMFACHPIARIVYPTLISVLGIPGLIGPFLPGFFDLRWEHPRTALYACLAISGFVPLIHAHVILPYRAANVLNFVLVYAMYLSYGIGLFFYATKIPERFSPGTFDLFFQSHNLWHIFVVGGAVIHMVNCYRLHQQWVAGTALGFQC